MAYTPHRGIGTAADLPQVPAQVDPATGTAVSAEQMPSGLSKLSEATKQAAKKIGDELNRPTSGAAFNIMPPECAALVQPRPVTGTVPANTTALIAVPLVAISDAKAAQALEQVYGNGSGGPALADALAAAKLGKTISELPNFVASGWMPDPGGNPAGGAFWLALRFPSALPVNVFSRVASNIVKKAYEKVGAPTVFVPGAVIAVDGDSDVAFQSAAAQSAATLVQTAEVFAAIVGARASLTRDAQQMATSFDRLATTVVKAAQNVAAAPQVLGQVDTIVATALRAPSSDAQQTVAGLAQLRQSLETARQEIVTGVENVPAVQREIAIKDDPNGSLAKRIRDEVLADTQAELAKINIAIAREYRQCMYFGQAQKALDSFLRTVAAAFERGEAACNLLVNNTDAIAQVLAGIDTAVAKLRKAEQQVPLSWFMREFKGAPRWVWVAGGMFVFVGGVATISVIKKRKKRSAAAAPSPELVANRRRRSRR